jgi:hypothetical protein
MTAQATLILPSCPYFLRLAATKAVAARRMIKKADFGEYSM